MRKLSQLLRRLQDPPEYLDCLSRCPVWKYCQYMPAAYPLFPQVPGTFPVQVCITTRKYIRSPSVTIADRIAYIVAGNIADISQLTKRPENEDGVNGIIVKRKASDPRGWRLLCKCQSLSILGDINDNNFTLFEITPEKGFRQRIFQVILY